MSITKDTISGYHFLDMGHKAEDSGSEEERKNRRLPVTCDPTGKRDRSMPLGDVRCARTCSESSSSQEHPSWTTHCSYRRHRADQVQHGQHSNASPATRRQTERPTSRTMLPAYAEDREYL